MLRSKDNIINTTANTNALNTLMQKIIMIVFAIGISFAGLNYTAKAQPNCPPGYVPIPTGAENYLGHRIEFDACIDLATNSCYISSITIKGICDEEDAKEFFNDNDQRLAILGICSDKALLNFFTDHPINILPAMGEGYWILNILLPACVTTNFGPEPDCEYTISACGNSPLTCKYQQQYYWGCPGDGWGGRIMSEKVELIEHNPCPPHFGCKNGCE